MGFGVNFGYAVQHLIDTQLNYVRGAHTVSLRLRNFPDLQDQRWAQLGFGISPTGASGSLAGTTDVPVAPPPGVIPVSIHNIGQSMGKLRFGARTFFVSASFVESQMVARSLSNQDLVWRNPDVVGLVLDGQLFSIESIAHVETAGHTISWELTCNSTEVK
jgi:hypothetical protein